MSKLEKAVEEALRRKKALSGEEEATPTPVAAAAPEVVEQPAAQVTEEVEEQSIDQVDEQAAPAIDDKPFKTVKVSVEPPREREGAKTSMHALLSKSNDFAAAEVYGKIKSRILRLSERAPELKRIMVTSTLKGEGKSLTAVNMAISFSRSYGQPVILVDSDLRAPSVHSYLETRSTPGLIQCVSHEASIDQALVETDIENLKVLPAGGAVANPVEFLSSTQCQKFIEELSRANKEAFIFFDAPPVLPFADAHALLPNIGGVIFVIREAFTRRDQLEEALLNLDDASFVGIVFNGATRNTKWKAKGGYGYGYGYGY